MRPDHLDEARIQALLHRELSVDEAARAGEHVKACPQCSRRLEDAREEERLVSGLLERLDTPAPRVDVDAVLAAAAQAPAASQASRGVRDRRPWNRWAAGLLLALGLGGAAYAIPGSPVRAWVDELIPKLFDRESSPGTVTPAPDSSVPLGGVAVKPGPTFLISIRHSSGGDVRVTLVPDEHVAVRAPAGAASYESGPDRLVIDALGGPAAFEIDIPRSAPRLEIQFEDSRIFLKEGDRTEPAFTGASATLPLPPK